MLPPDLSWLPSLARLIRGGALTDGLTPHGVTRLAGALASGRRDLFAALGKHAAERPDAPAIDDGDRRLSFGALFEMTEHVAARLWRLGLRPGDRVAIALENRAEHLILQAALYRLGAVPAPMTPGQPPALLRGRLLDARIAAALVEPELAEPAQEALARLGRAPHMLITLNGELGGTAFSSLERPCAPLPPRFDGRGDEADLLLFTSGTTGRSKGARISMRRAGLGLAFVYLDTFGFRPGDGLYTPCPAYHAAPTLLLGVALLSGAQVVLRRRFDADEAIALLGPGGLTHAFLVPTLLSRLDALPDAALAPLSQGRLRALISGGAPLRPALKTRLLDRLGPVLWDLYGATELGVVSVGKPEDLHRRPDCVGRPLPGLSVRIVRDDGQDAGVDEPGELFVQSRATHLGYEGDPAATGWVSAGDVAALGADGLLRVLDRKKDMILSGGVNLFPAEIEEALESLVGVAEAVCVGVPDDEWGERARAYVVAAPGVRLEPEALRAEAAKILPKTSVPREIVLVAEIPRSPTGKVNRRALTGDSP